jgi:hypothetical protein
MAFTVSTANTWILKIIGTAMADRTPMTDRTTDRVDMGARNTTHNLPWMIGIRWGGLWAAGVLAATGLLFVWQASMLDLGHVGLPGPGFFPMLLGALLVAFSIVIGVDRWRTSAESEPVALGHPHVLIVFVALLVVPLLFEQLGAYLTLGLFSLSLLVFMAGLSLLLAGVWTILGLAACWYLFEVLLGLRLPMGPF